MEVKENLISLKVLWRGKLDRVADTQRTKDAIAEWLLNEDVEISMELCGAPKEGPIDLVLENHYSDGEVDKKLLAMHLRELIKLFRENTEVDKLWLKWNDIVDDIIWTDEKAQIDINRVEHKKGDYIQVHQHIKKIQKNENN